MGNPISNAIYSACREKWLALVAQHKRHLPALKVDAVCTVSLSAQHVYRQLTTLFFRTGFATKERVMPPG